MPRCVVERNGGRGRSRFIGHSILERDGWLCAGANRGKRDGWLCAGEPVEEREELLAEHLVGSRVNLVFNECFERDGALSYEQMARFNAVAQRHAKPQDDTTVH